MKKLMLRHAFQFVNSVIFIIGVRNLRSQKAIEKIGGVRVGSRLTKMAAIISSTKSRGAGNDSESNCNVRELFPLRFSLRIFCLRCAQCRAKFFMQRRRNARRKMIQLRIREC